MALRVHVDENLRCTGWNVETVIPGYGRVELVVAPLIDVPFPEGMRRALDEMLKQHRAHLSDGPFG